MLPDISPELLAILLHFGVSFDFEKYLSDNDDYSDELMQEYRDLLTGYNIK